MKPETSEEALLTKMEAAWRRLWTHLYRGETKLIYDFVYAEGGRALGACPHPRK